MEGSSQSATASDPRPDFFQDRILPSLERVGPALRAPGYAGWVLAAVLACIAYAAFAGGATTIPEQSRTEYGIAAALLLAGLGLASGTLGAARSPLAWAGVGLLALFAFYSALSVGWSIAPDQGWLAANRAASYAALVAVVLVAAPAVRRAPELAIASLTALVVAVALYALAGKLLPTVSIGPVDFDQTEIFARLREPLGYWNALGLLFVIATPGCIWAASDRSRSRRLRIGALCVLTLLLVATALTLSRGAVVALVVAVAVLVAAAPGPERLRRLATAGAGVLGAIPTVALAFSLDPLTRDNVIASDRELEGAIVFVVLLVSLAAVAGLGSVLISAEGRVGWSAERSRKTWRALAGTAIALVLAGLVALAISGPSKEWNEFRESATVTANDPGRLLSSSGSNRWSWWNEAEGAFFDRPVAGWGAGSFPLIHDRYRESVTQVRSAHDVPLQFLAEGGLIGALIALGGLGLLGAAAVRTTLRSSGREREARLVLCAIAAAWAVHCLYDWDWEIPAVTLPALAAAAIAATPFGGTRAWFDPPPKRGGTRRKAKPGLAVPVAAASALLAAAIAVSAALPAAAEDKRLEAQAEAEAAGTDPEAIKDAAQKAELARRLNPLDEQALFVAADLQVRLVQIGKAQELLFEAARVQPDNYRVWDRLVEAENALGDYRLASIAVQKRIEAEPLSFATDPEKSAGLLFVSEVPAQLSPTAFGTPP